MKKIIYSSKVNNLIALYNILDEFEEFEKRLRTVISPKYNRDFVNQLWHISHGNFKIGTRKAKKFYEKNKMVIDTINTYSTISMFINDNYDWYGNPKGSLQIFYEYISDHKEQMEKILAVLVKLNELGIGELDFNDELDFTHETQKIYTQLSDNLEIAYLDNLTVIPDYNPGSLLYKTNDSNYKITVGFKSGENVRYRTKVVLNSLMFDPNRLPKNLSKEETFDKIIGLKEQKQEEYSAIRDSVTLGIGIDDLYAMFNSINSKINSLESVERKSELIELLAKIKEAILKMQTISAEYNQQIAGKNPSISEKFLDEQKQAFVKRREDAKIHIL